MFGYLTADSSKLSEEELVRYKACYCGLCRSLGQRHGQLSRLSLNYDMTFLVLLLSSLYEPEEKTGESVCLPHPVKARAWWFNEASDYAADMNLALAYHKCLDDWKDERKISALLAAFMLKGKYRKIEKAYPRQCAAIAESMKKLHELEKSGSTDADACAQSFGSLMAEVLVWKEDRWAEHLRNMGMNLGSFIYIMDAVMDLDKDIEKGRFNPLKAYASQPSKEQHFRDILKLLLGDCLYYFDFLPLVQDTSIMKNILCAGLWAEFDKKYDKKESSDVSGSI